MSKTRWITRDDYAGSDYELWTRKPKRNGDEWHNLPMRPPCYIEALCADDFEQATGIKLKPGEIAKIRFEKIEVRK